MVRKRKGGDKVQLEVLLDPGVVREIDQVAALLGLSRASYARQSVLERLSADKRRLTVELAELAEAREGESKS